jgi:hypothetical protein
MEIKRASQLFATFLRVLYGFSLKKMYIQGAYIQVNRVAVKNGALLMNVNIAHLQCTHSVHKIDEKTDLIFNTVKL